MEPNGHLRNLLIRAIGDRSRPEVADCSRQLAGRVWGVDAPDFDDQFVRDASTRLVGIPRDGRAFRALLAALDVPLVQALEAAYLWPDLRLGSLRPMSNQDLLLEGARMVGLRATVKSQNGRTVVLEIE